MQATGIAGALYSSGSLEERPSAAQAAREFEALLIAQLIKTAREGAAGPADESAEAKNYLEFAEKQLAEALAESGAFGFAKVLLRSLSAEGADGGGEPGGRF